MKWLLPFFLLLFVLSSCGDVRNLGPEQNWDWKTYTSRDGLAGNEVHEILVTNDNVKWFGTEYGASSFVDGVWTSYNVSGGLIYQKVLALAEDKQGNIWFGTPFGVSSYDGNNWVSYTKEDGLPDNYVYDIAVDGNNTKWFATFSGAASFDGEQWNYYTKEEGNSIVYNHVRSVEIDNQDNVWFGTEFGISMYDGSTWTNFTTDEAKEGNSWNYITDVDVKPEDNSVWFSTLAGVIYYQDNDYNFIPYSDGLAYNQVYGVAFENKNTWVATQRGASRFDGVQWHNYNSRDGLGADWISDLEVDNNGIVWFATIAGGVTSLDTGE